MTILHSSLLLCALVFCRGSSCLFLCSFLCPMKICLCSLLLTVLQNSDFNSSCKKVLGNLEEKMYYNQQQQQSPQVKSTWICQLQKLQQRKNRHSHLSTTLSLPFFSPNDVPSEGNFGPMQTYKQHATLQWDLCSDRGIYRPLGCTISLTRICQESLHKGPHVIHTHTSKNLCSDSLHILEPKCFPQSFPH